MTILKEGVSIFLEEANQLVEPKILELLENGIEDNNLVVLRHQILTGGKRIRPALAIASCQLIGGKIEDVLYPAAALEILHNFTLIIDDIIDRSELRRNKPTVWREYGTSIAECISMDYASSIFQGVNRSSKRKELVDIFSLTLKKIGNGEIQDILFEYSGREDESFVVQHRYHNISKDDYFEMIDKKTASLMKTCCQVGAICGGGTDYQVGLLSEYGHKIGMAFQIQDDILDVFGDERRFGKEIGKDIREKKRGNIVVTLALEELKVRGKAILDKFISEKPISDKDLIEIMALIEETQAREKAEKMAVEFQEAALQTLKELPQNESSDTLKNIAVFITERKT